MDFNKILDPIKQRIEGAPGITKGAKKKLMDALNSLEAGLTKLNNVTEKLSKEQRGSLINKTDYNEFLAEVQSLKTQLNALSTRSSSTRSRSKTSGGRRRNRRTKSKKNKSIFSFFM